MSDYNIETSCKSVIHCDKCGWTTQIDSSGRPERIDEKNKIKYVWGPCIHFCSVCPPVEYEIVEYPPLKLTYRPIKSIITHENLDRDATYIDIKETDLSDRKLVYSGKTLIFEIIYE